MKTLNKDWITEKHIDFEYKKYILLAYLQSVEKDFEQTKLYPTLADLIEHYKQVRAIKESRENLLHAFPQKLSAVDWEKFKLMYQKIIDDDAIMSELESIINFSIPQFERYLSEGKKIYDFVEEHIHIFPVGVLPLMRNWGYMLLQDGKTAATAVYEYQITIFEQSDERYRGIHANYVTSFTYSLSNTFEHMKKELIRSKPDMPNPATFAMETDMAFPLTETFLPIAKRVLVKHIGQEEIK